MPCYRGYSAVAGSVDVSDVGGSCASGSGGEGLPGGPGAQAVLFAAVGEDAHFVLGLRSEVFDGVGGLTLDIPDSGVAGGNDASYLPCIGDGVVPGHIGRVGQCINSHIGGHLAGSLGGEVDSRRGIAGGVAAHGFDAGRIGGQGVKAGESVGVLLCRDGSPLALVALAELNNKAVGFAFVPAEIGGASEDFAHGKAGQGVAGGHFADEDVVDAQVVVATTPHALGVEGDTDGLADILLKAYDLVHIFDAGEVGVGLFLSALPDGGIILEPGGAAVGRDDDHEGLRGIGVAVLFGQCCSGIVGEGNVERELRHFSIAQVDIGGNHPRILIGTIYVPIV